MVKKSKHDKLSGLQINKAFYTRVVKGFHKLSNKNHVVSININNIFLRKISLLARDCMELKIIAVTHTCTCNYYLEGFIYFFNISTNFGNKEIKCNS